MGSNVQLDGPSENLMTPNTTYGMVGNETLGDKVSCGGDNLKYQKNSSKKYNHEMFIDGVHLNFNYEDEDAIEKKKTWLDEKNYGTSDPNVLAIRKDMKSGVLSYQDYMESRMQKK